MTDTITLPRAVVEMAAERLREAIGVYAECPEDIAALNALEAALDAALAKPDATREPVAYFDLQKQVFYWARPTMIDVPMTIALEPLPLYAAPPDAEALRRDAERLKDAMRKAMAMLDKHEPEPAGAFAVLLLALNPELQSAKNAALRREDV
jgi:hypothetical protein